MQSVHHLPALDIQGRKILPAHFNPILFQRLPLEKFRPHLRVRNSVPRQINIPFHEGPACQRKRLPVLGYIKSCPVTALRTFSHKAGRFPLTVSRTNHFIHAPPLPLVIHSRTLVPLEQQHGTVVCPTGIKCTIRFIKQKTRFHVRPHLFSPLIKVITGKIEIPQFDHQQHPQQHERAYHQYRGKYRSGKGMFLRFHKPILSV